MSRLTFAFLMGSFIFVGSPALATTLEFQPTLTAWLCPAGAHYPIMECKANETKLAPVKVEMRDIRDGFFIGSWEAVSKSPATHAHIIVMKFPNSKDGKIHWTFSAYSGWSESYEQNAGVFMEWIEGHEPMSLMVNGDHKPLGNGTKELVSTFELNDFKILP